mmetsp:Transcript_25417/g.60555  ORF Transcript_25417/g.60555 Transcript_25417/m.60555 type:complete len:1120 (-) Transcript_25417:137-3496(-)
MQRCGLLVALWLLAGAAPPCTWDATEPCYLQLGSVFEFRDRTGSDFDRDDRAMIENDCDGRALTPYIDAVNNLNEGRGILVHSAGLEIAQSTPKPKYYYRLNYTRLTFDEDNWTQGEALSFQHFPSWSFIPGIGNGCNDFHVVEQAKVANAAARIWMTPRGPWSQMSRSTGGPLPWAFSSHLDSWDYSQTAVQQFALKGAKKAAVIYWCCTNTFFTGVGQGALQHLAANGFDVVKAYEMQDNMTVLEEAIDWIITERVDVVLTGLTTGVFQLFLERLEEFRHQYVPDGIFAVNLPWMREGERCFGLGETCSYILTGAQPFVFPQITHVIRDGVIGLNGSEYGELLGTEPAYDPEVGLSAFLQAVQTVFQFREVKDPTNLLHSPLDPDVYLAVRDLMLSGESFGNTFAGPAAFNPWGQINGMPPPTATIKDNETLSVLFPPEYADAPFSYPLPAARTCEEDWYKVWRPTNESCLLCHADCRPCPANSQRDGDAFACSCRRGFYEGLGSDCLACPTGVICEEPGSELVSLNLSRGYWRFARDVADVYECSTEDACLGGTAFGDEGCEVGHEGPKCEECSDMFFRELDTGLCRACSSTAVFLGPVQWLALMMSALLCIFICFGRRIRRFLENATLNGKPKLKELKTKIKIAVSLLQVMNMVPGVLPFIEWPSLFLSFVNALGIFNLSIFQVLQADCIHPNSFYDRLLVNTLLPMSIWAVLGLSCGIHTLRQKAEDRGETVSGYIGAALLVAYLSLPVTSNTIFDTFKCEAFDAGSGNRRNFLASDLRLDCDTDTHRNFQIYAGVMALVYPIGIPIWMAASLYRHRGAIAPPVNFYEMSRAQTEFEELSAGMSMRAKLKKTFTKLGSGSGLETNAPAAAADNSDPVLKLVSLETGRQYRGFLTKDSKEWAGMKKREDDSSIQHLIFIYDDYKPSCLYFEVFESMRKVFLSAVLAFCIPGSWMQIVIGILACQLTLKILHDYKPYANASAGVAAETAQRILFLSLVFGLLLFTAKHSEEGSLGLDFGPSSTLSYLMTVTIIVGTVLGIVFGLGKAFTEVEFRSDPPEGHTVEEMELPEDGKDPWAAEGVDEDLEAIGGKQGADDKSLSTCRADDPNEPMDWFAM